MCHGTFTFSFFFTPLRCAPLPMHLSSPPVERCFLWLAWFLLGSRFVSQLKFAWAACIFFHFFFRVWGFHFSTLSPPPGVSVLSPSFHPDASSLLIFPPPGFAGIRRLVFFFAGTVSCAPSQPPFFFLEGDVLSCLPQYGPTPIPSTFNVGRRAAWQSFPFLLGPRPFFSQ